MRFNRRAALELSITAIVVLIIAITVLGLGIGFIKKQFGAGTELVQRELTGIKDQLRDQIKTSGELLVFSLPEQVSIGKPEGTIIGVRNTAANPEGDRVCYQVEVKCIKPFTPDTFCGDTNNIVVGGYDHESGSPVAGNQNWFRSILGEFDLKNYEGDVWDAVLQVRGIKPDSYAMEINVYKDPLDGDCAHKSFGSEDKPYASKSFVLNVV